MGKVEKKRADKLTANEKFKLDTKTMTLPDVYTVKSVIPSQIDKKNVRIFIHERERPVVCKKNELVIIIK